MQSPSARFAHLLLVTALLFGLIIRMAAPINAGGPVNDGGMFLQMILDLQNNGFQLPDVTTYNNADIPFVYPPLGFYLAGGIQSMTQIPFQVIFQYLPAILSTLAIAAFYFLALQITGDKLKASLATLFYALTPQSFDWSIMGGGVTRAPALIFSFLTLAFAYRLFTTGDARQIVPTSLSATLLVLSHPEITLQTVVSIGVLALFFLRGRSGIIQSMVVAGLTALLTLPWWLTVVSQHGLAPFQAALAAHPRNFAYSLLYLFQFNLTGETLLAIVAILGLIGLVQGLLKRQWFLPVWIGLSFVTDPRAAPFVSLIPLALLAVDGLDTILRGMGLPLQMEQGFDSKPARFILVGLIAYLFMSGLILSMWFGNELRILPEERQAFQWIMENTPENSRFLLLTGHAALSDPVSEWFPVLSSRTSIVTVQGHEWTTASPLLLNLQSYTRAQACLHKNPRCLSSWDFEYLYIRRVWPGRQGNVTPQSFVLETGLRSSNEYELVYESETSLIFAREVQQR